MNRKLRKLIRNPSLFARDMIGNRVAKVRRALPRLRTVSGTRRYSVVAAVYGVEKYLDEFLDSLVRQTLDFEKHIEVILVDDGSPDRSADVIARWQKKHPRSIRYIKKENGGQASARNVGLECATGDWITFIDPDDFVDEQYFESVERFLDRPDAENVALLSCNFILFDEKAQRARDTHPLRYRFTAGDRVVRMSELRTDIQLSVNSAFFRGDFVRSMALRFDEAIRPSFEDAHFANRYLLAVGDRAIGFSAGAKYYYRKRADQSSTLDRSWTRPGLFGDVLELGCLDLLRRARAGSATGEVPVWIQRVVLYHLIWYFKRLVNGAASIAFLSDDQRTRFQRLLRELLAEIDTSTILEFELGGAWFYHKVGLLGFYKDAAPPAQHVYVQAYDAAKGLVQLRYFHHRERELESFWVGDIEVFPTFAKERRHDLLGETFVFERVVWLSIRHLTGRLKAQIGDVDTRMCIRGKVHRDGVSIDDIVAVSGNRRPSRLPREARVEYALANSPAVVARFRGAFLFMDRDTQADDNAEHLYRYCREAHPEINAFFVLRRNSHDWNRLERDGFKLLAFGTLTHRLALLNASHIISSHVDHYVVSHPQGRALTEAMQARITFLQHGVTTHDISAWLNEKAIECFVTASPAEYASIAESGTPYRYCEREVVLSGFPRHDALLAGAPSDARVLVIMPTWRSGLMGPVTGRGNQRSLNPAFYESEYAQAWRSLLHSPALRTLAETQGFRVKFFPHANIQPYLEWFDSPRYVETVSHRPDRSIQEVFKEATMMLTDYSSVAFEMSYLRRPTVYYQFDRDSVYGGGHLTQKGYFDYERDGFGPVCLDEDSVIDALARIMSAGGRPSAEYLARMERTFAFRDGRCCERTLQAILDLDRPVHQRERSTELRLLAAHSATQHEAWAVAERRWQGLLESLPADGSRVEAELRLVEAKRRLGKLDEADELLTAMAERAILSPGVELERAELATSAENWALAARLWSARAKAATTREAALLAHLRLAEAQRRVGNFEAARETLDGIRGNPEPIPVRAERAELATAEAQWELAARGWQELSAEPGAPEESRYRWAEALARLGDEEGALARLAEYLGSPRPARERAARRLRLELAARRRERSRAVDEGGDVTRLERGADAESSQSLPAK